MNDWLSKICSSSTACIINHVRTKISHINVNNEYIVYVITFNINIIDTCRWHDHAQQTNSDSIPN